MNTLCNVCGAELGGPYCGQCGAWNDDGTPPERPDRVCPVCGTINPPGNVHCEACAFRLDNAYQPASDSVRLRRLVVVGAMVIFGIVALVVLVNSLLDGDDSATAETASTTTAPDVPAADEVPDPPIAEPEPLEVGSVSASSSFNESFGPQNLIDGDPGSYWNDDSQHGEGAELVFEFSTPVSIDRILIQNVADELAFRRNYRIRGYEIATDDLPTPFVGELADNQDVQTVALSTEATTRLTLRVTSTYEAESVDGQPPFEELAVAEVTLMGWSRSP